MRTLLRTVLVMVLAVFLSGAQAFAADCCGDDCRQEAPGGGPEEAAGHDSETPGDAGDACPVTCQACPWVRTVIPLPSDVPSIPGTAPPVLVEWMERGPRLGAPYVQDIFQPPRAG